MAVMNPAVMNTVEARHPLHLLEIEESLMSLNHDLATDMLYPDDYYALLVPLLGERVDALTHEQLASSFALVAWSSVTEPGDAIAGELIAEFGPEIIYKLAAGVTSSLRNRLVEAFVGSDHYGDDTPVIDAATIDSALARWQPRLNIDRVITECRNAAELGIQLVTRDTDDWPAHLDDLGPHRPHALWTRGNLEHLESLAQSVAIVGSRASTPYGEHVAAECAAVVSDAGIAVVSGGAYGIDRVAHLSALASEGVTAAVLAGGVDRLYPSGNRELFDRMIERGLVLSELPVGRAPERWRFLQRNRLIAALTQATVVVEAGARSGARSTAHHALQLGRAVGAVPGPITSAASVGCHELIDVGHARILTRPTDVVDLWREGAGVAPLQPTLWEPTHDQSPLVTRVFDALGQRAWRSVPDLAVRSGCSVAEVQRALTELDLSGAAIESAKGWKRA